MKWTINNSKFVSLGYVVNEFEGKEIDLITVQELRFLQSNHPNKNLVDIFGRICKASEANDDDRMGWASYALLENIK